MISVAKQQGSGATGRNAPKSAVKVLGNPLAAFGGLVGQVLMPNKAQKRKKNPEPMQAAYRFRVFVY